ncbi:MAG TPA: DEAD/DEAH box helicase [Candidatus Saccharimonadia bacterium]|jgi:superfamily II DNA/RNA helicase|nr:DEAD/DEAH box helicase [Candidatus Saccharimonadia bacterium]
MFSSKNLRQPKVKTVDPNKFINKAVAPLEEVVFTPVNTFKDFQFDDRLQFNVDNHGYTTPTPIQDGAIPFVLSGRDLIGLANTGTGKTAAFLLPVLQRMLHGMGSRCLILVPTRELAIQIEEEFRIFARGLNLYATLVVGGASVGRQLSQLSRRPQFIIATPGRLKDLVENYGQKLNDFDVLVLDEADRMLDMGFIKDIRTIMSYLTEERQTLFFSATITPDIEQLLTTILKDPETVSVRKGETSDHVEQDVIRIEGGKEAKEEKLVELLSDPDFKKVLVFGETKWGVQKLADRLEKRGLKVAAIHGNKSQPQRQRALSDFKAEKVQALIATDVAARGLDIPNVSHVINFDPPQQYEDYVHRIGRTGRAGAMGKALTFVSVGPAAFVESVRATSGGGSRRGARR